MRLTDKSGQARGFFRLWSVAENGLWLPASAARKRNQIQLGWAIAAAKLFALADLNYRVAAMYIEYENVGDPEDEVTPPAYTADENLAYYDDLALSATKDFLRVPLGFDPTPGVVAGYEDVLPAGTKNKLTYSAQTRGLTGIHGKAYGSGSNSKVFGAALVVTPVADDRTKDLVVARTYVEAADQVPQESFGQVGITWDLEFLI